MKKYSLVLEVIYKSGASQTIHTKLASLNDDELTDLKELAKTFKEYVQEQYSNPDKVNGYLTVSDTIVCIKETVSTTIFVKEYENMD